MEVRGRSSFENHLDNLRLCQGQTGMVVPVPLGAGVQRGVSWVQLSNPIGF